MSLAVLIAAAVLPVCQYATESIERRIASADPAVCLSRFADYPPSKGTRRNGAAFLVKSA